MKIYFDMDGVLADWERGFRKFIRDVSYEELNNLPKDEYDKIKHKISHLPNFYYYLPVMTHATEKLIELIEDGHDVAILTAVGKINSDHIIQQKKRWLKKIFSFYEIEFHAVTRSRDKAQFADSNSILIDDRAKSTVAFREAGGKVIDYTDGKTNLDEELAKYI